MPRNKVTEVFKYDELDDRAKEKAREWFCRDLEYPWAQENVDSLQKFAKWFQLRIMDYSLGGSDNRGQGVKYDIRCDDNIRFMSGVRLWKYFQNNPHMLPDLNGSCPFTGYCMDETLLDPFRKFMQRPDQSTYEDLVQESIHAFCKAYADDVDYQYEDEVVEENIIANEYEFDVYGNPE